MTRLFVTNLKQRAYQRGPKAHRRCAWLWSLLNDMRSGVEVGAQGGCVRAVFRRPAAPRVRPRRAPNRDGGCPRTHGNAHGARFGASLDTCAGNRTTPRQDVAPPGSARDPRKSPSDGPSGLMAPAAPGRFAHGRPHARARDRNRPYRPSTAVDRGRHGGRTPGSCPSWPYTPGAVGLAVHVQIPRELPYGPPPYGGRVAAKSLIWGLLAPVSAPVWP
jgi:hypothetical protein